MTWLYADTPNIEAAAAVIQYMGSAEGQRAMVELSERFLVSTIEEANTSADPALLNDRAALVADLAAASMRTCPQFEIRNEEAGKVTLKLQSSDPSISAVIEGVFTGQIADAE